MERLDLKSTAEIAIRMLEQGEFYELTRFAKVLKDLHGVSISNYIRKPASIELWRKGKMIYSIGRRPNYEGSGYAEEKKKRRESQEPQKS